MRIVPASRPGRLAMWAQAAFLALVLLNLAIAIVWGDPDWTLGSLNVLGALPFFALVVGLGAGLVAVRHDRAALVWSAILLGAAVLAFEGAELVF